PRQRRPRRRVLARRRGGGPGGPGTAGPLAVDARAGAGGVLPAVDRFRRRRVRVLQRPSRMGLAGWRGADRPRGAVGAASVWLDAMRLKSATLRTFLAVHTWTGLVAGFALFVAFYAGAITVFHHDLPAWQSRAVAEQPVQPLDEAQRLLDGVLQRHPEARAHVGMLFPGVESPQSSAYWQDASGTWLYATVDDLDGSPKPPQAGLPELLNELHYSLGLPIVGTWLMGLVSLLYGMALLSGVVIHLPRLLQNLFALRPGRNLKQFWQDAHNVVGVLSLPMHVMFAITGALLCLLFVLMTALNPLVYDGKLMAAAPAAMDTAPVRSAAGVEAPAGSLAMWRARS